MNELDEQCPKKKISKLQEQLAQKSDLDISKMKSAWEETGEIFKSAIDYMANQSTMMSEVNQQNEKNFKELQKTRKLLVAVCFGAMAASFARHFF